MNEDTSKMFIYRTNPMDFFETLLPIDEAAKRLEGCGGEVFKLFKLAMACSRAVSLAKGSCWEGDIRGHDLFVFALPIHDEFPLLGLIWKQANNGTTFICSPIALPWISEDDLLSPAFHTRKQGD